MLKDQRHDAHLVKKWIKPVISGPLDIVTISVDNLFVLTTLITLIKVHITSISICPYLCYFKLNIYSGLLCTNISESILYVLRISYWWYIRAIYRQYFKILDVNIVYRWLWYPTSNWFLKHTRLILKYSYIAALHIYSLELDFWILENKYWCDMYYNQSDQCCWNK